MNVNNVWLGIFTGIVSGVIVYFITTHITHKQDRKNYNKRMEDTIKQMLHTLKVYLLTYDSISYETYEKLISSIAEENGIKTADIYPKGMYYELIPSFFTQDYN